MGKADETRARILEAAIRRIAREGIDGVRIARIAMDAGVSAALVALPLRLPRRPAVEALEHSYEMAGDTRATPTRRTRPPTERLEAIDRLEPARRRRERDDFAAVGRAVAAREPAARSCARSPRACTRACTSGSRAVIAEFGVDDVARTTDHLLALIDGYGVRALFGDPAMPVERAREEIWAAIAPSFMRRAP